ncbi:GNAT family N-acetyltransferase [Hyphomonas oceanitis]|uniref:Acetyltransferase n=1 Tax=Hyphomonas oceanitis SCH89 TaxID=1280953 RepID=A0A059GAR5_9PROT|nr:GNAT family N-acetyltransferase [Hyphomonas oceanitis]KDA03922.1 acetyltransferase [Hyphomonas oceanitis SCH89]
MRRLPDDYSITRAARDEIPALIRVDLAASTLFAETGLLSAEALNDHVPQEVFEQAIANDDLLVARDHKGRAVGFALTSQRGGTLYLDQISVHPDHGRKGLGRALIARLASEAKARKLKCITLSTFRDLAWNGPFYRRLGFREIAATKKADWMIDLEKVQATSLDLSKRCFMMRRIGWL